MAKSKLDDNQKTFIEKKVKELGTIDKVKKLYDKDASVDKFAVKYAKKILK